MQEPESPKDMARSFRAWMDERVPGWREHVLRMAADKNPNWTRIEYKIVEADGNAVSCTLFDRGDDRPDVANDVVVELIRFPGVGQRPPEETD